ncbi:hypothetical protein L2E82_44125 [Cichorium intybus]|uniref:Uncharacterized protein n=1 Tax=Cichorium intybus TaxID=13427 RepID=A0ACB8ZPW0_CICIN|nr:hypothetical protein L2E82_44125 [Cichorium intybus]
MSLIKRSRFIYISFCLGGQDVTYIYLHTNLINTGFKILYRKRTNQTLQENSPIRTLATDLHLHKSTLLQSSSTNIYNNLQFTIKILKK